MTRPEFRCTSHPDYSQSSSSSTFTALAHGHRVLSVGREGIAHNDIEPTIVQQLGNLLDMSSFRSIRPSSSSHTTSAAEDNHPLSPSHHSESSSLGFPPSSSVADASVSVGKGRKRKAPVSVSQNACTNCKRARAKVRFCCFAVTMK